MRIAILTVSDRATTGEYPDGTGPALRQLLEERLGGSSIVATKVVPDEWEEIAGVVVEWCDGDMADLIVTNGGTGLSARDVTPEAIESVVDRLVPGIGEAMRTAGRSKTPLADLSRSLAGQRGQTLIVAVPGSVKGATESLAAVTDLLPHAIEMIKS